MASEAHYPAKQFPGAYDDLDDKTLADAVARKTWQTEALRAGARGVVSVCARFTGTARPGTLACRSWPGLGRTRPAGAPGPPNDGPRPARSPRPGRTP